MNLPSSEEPSEKVLLNQIVQQIGQIDSLDIKTLRELDKVFNSGTPFEEHTFRTILKEKIISILLNQRNYYTEYLNLPRFSVLTDEARKQLFEILQRVKTHFDHQFQMIINQNKEKKKLASLIPPLNNLNEVENYHLSILNMYRQSMLCPKQYNQMPSYGFGGYPHMQMMRGDYPMPYANNMYSPHSPSNIMFNYSYQQPGMNLPFMNPQPQINNNMFQYPQMHNYESKQPSNKQVRMNNNNQQFPPQVNFSSQSIIADPFQSQNIYNDNHNYYPSGNIQGAQKINVNQKNPFNIKKSDRSYKDQKTDKNQKKIGKEVKINKQPSSNKSYKQYGLNKTNNSDEYKKCACRGSLNSNPLKQRFICCSCNNNFHLQCLNVAMGKSQNIKCPQCTLKSPNLILTVVQTIESGWMVSQSDSDSWKCILKKKDIVKVTQKGRQEYQIHLRFLKLEKKQQQNSAFDAQVRDIFDEEQPNDSRKISSIRIQVQQLAKTNQEIPIQVNPREQQQNESGNHVPQLFFFGLYLLKINNSASIIKQISNDPKCHVGREYLNNFFKQGNISQITVSLIDQPQTQLMMIDIPVRGNKCVHPRVFDLNNFLQISLQTRQQAYCPICSKVCQYLIVDDFIKSLIIADAQGSIPQSFNYNFNGQVKYSEHKIAITKYNQQSEEMNDDFDNDENQEDQDSKQSSSLIEQENKSKN